MRSPSFDVAGRGTPAAVPANRFGACHRTPDRMTHDEAHEARFHPVRLGEIADFPPEPGGVRPRVTAFVADPAAATTTAELAYVHNTGGTSAHWLDPHAMFVIWSKHPLGRFRWE